MHTLNSSRKWHRVIGISSIIFALPVLAIEQQGGEDVVQPKTSKKEAVDLDTTAVDEPQKNAMLGVGGSSVSKTLSLHLGLDEGAGLTLFYIVPRSAADKAGLKPHDVITEFGSKPIGSQLDLKEAIGSYHSGDEVSVQFIHQGKAVEKKIILGARPKNLKAMRDRGIHPRWMLQGLGGEIPEEQRKLMADQMKQNMEKLKQRLNDQGDLELRSEVPQLDTAEKKELQHLLNMKATSSITMSDGKGSVTMKSRNGQKEITVKDEQGKITYEGPYSTAQDKEALPDDVRDRVSQFNFGEDGGKGFHFKVNPDAQITPPVSGEDQASH